MEDQLHIQSADALQLELPIAGLGSRSYAFIIDWHIRLVLALGWFFLIYAIYSGIVAPGADDFFFNDAWRDLAIWPAVILYFLYHPILEIMMKGRTPGKRMVGVRIVTLEGYTPSVTALFTRNIFRLVDSLPQFYLLGMITCGVTKQQVRFGDMAAGTLLIHEKKATDKDLDQMMQLGTHGRLAPEQFELVQELRSRWASLTQSSRIRLAESLLEKIQEPLPVRKKSPFDQERELLLVLDRLAQETTQ